MPQIVAKALVWNLRRLARGGNQYVGGFRDDKYHGQGTPSFPNSTEFVGEFKDGRLAGTGTE